MLKDDFIRILIPREDKAKIFKLAESERLTVSALIRKTMLDMYDSKFKGDDNVCNKANPQ